jgi:hypothetical protein
MKPRDGLYVEINEFLPSAIDAGEWWASRPAASIPRKEPPSPPWFGGPEDPKDSDI